MLNENTHEIEHNNNINVEQMNIKMNIDKKTLKTYIKCTSHLNKQVIFHWPHSQEFYLKGCTTNE